MHIFSRNVLLSAILSLITLTASAENCRWQLVETVDKMNDEKIRSALCLFSTGHSLSIFRRADGPAYAMLSLPSGTGEVFGTRRLQYRIDSNKAEDLESQRSIEKYAPQLKVKAEPTTTAWVIWHGGANAQANTGTLRDLMDGNTLLIRYYKFPEGSADLEFSLEGAKPIIAQALNINAEADQEVAKEEIRKRQVTVEASRKCLQENRGNKQGYIACVEAARNNPVPDK